MYEINKITEPKRKVTPNAQIVYVSCGLGCDWLMLSFTIAYGER